MLYLVEWQRSDAQDKTVWYPWFSVDRIDTLVAAYAELQMARRLCRSGPHRVIFRVLEVESGQDVTPGDTPGQD